MQNLPALVDRQWQVCFSFFMGRASGELLTCALICKERGQYNCLIYYSYELWPCVGRTLSRNLNLDVCIYVLARARARPRIILYTRGVVTGQVFRYLPDHFFSRLPERLPIQNGRSLLASLANWIVFDTNCSWLFRSYYDRDRHTFRLQFYLQDDSETSSEGLKVQYLPGEACALRMRTFLVQRPLKLPDH